MFAHARFPSAFWRQAKPNRMGEFGPFSFVIFEPFPNRAHCSIQSADRRQAGMFRAPQLS